MTTVGVAVIGTGYWGPGIVRNLAALPAARLTHLIDKVPGRATDCARRLCPGVPSDLDAAVVFADPATEAVVIATPAATHFELARDALIAGKHVLVEKPMAMTVPHCLELEALAQTHGRVLMVGHIFRFHPAILEVKRYLDEGELGDLLYVHSRRVNLGRVQADINALWSFAPHDFSILRYWLGGDPETVQARGFSCISEGVEDVIFATLTWKGGVGAHVHMGWLDPRKVREMTVVGRKKMVVFDDVVQDHKLRLYDSSVTPVRKSPDSFAEWAFDVRSGDIMVPRLEWTEPLRAELVHFFHCVRGEASCLVPGSEGTAVTRAILAAQESLRTGGAVVRIEG